MLRQWTFAIGCSLPLADCAAAGPRPVWHSVGPAPPAVEAAAVSDPASQTLCTSGASAAACIRARMTVQPLRRSTTSWAMDSPFSPW